MSDARHDGHAPEVGAAGDVRAAFPRLEARRLTGRRYVLPDDFRGDPTIVLVAFEQWQQARVDAWLPALVAWAARGQDLQLYELVVAPRLYLPARPFIDGSMATAIGGASVRARTLTTYTDVRGVVSALGLPDARDIALLLVDRVGRLSWQARGAKHAGGAAALARVVGPTSLLRRMPPYPRGSGGSDGPWAPGQEMRRNIDKKEKNLCHPYTQSLSIPMRRRA